MNLRMQIIMPLTITKINSPLIALHIMHVDGDLPETVLNYAFVYYSFKTLGLEHSNIRFYKSFC